MQHEFERISTLIEYINVRLMQMSFYTNLGVNMFMQVDNIWTLKNKCGYTDDTP